MKWGGGKKRRDANEAGILEALQARGAQTWQINGRKLPDVLVLYKGRWTPLGVKTETGRLRPGEAEAAWAIIRSIDDALKAIGVQG